MAYLSRPSLLHSAASLFAFRLSLASLDGSRATTSSIHDHQVSPLPEQIEEKNASYTLCITMAPRRKGEDYCLVGHRAKDQNITTGKVMLAVIAYQ
jgi:hypothetical protein